MKRVSIAFALLALLLFKASSFHVYEHQEDNLQIEDCELCEYAMKIQESEFPSFTGIEVPLKTDIVLLLEALSYYTVDETSAYQLHFPFSRPPPTVVI